MNKNIIYIYENKNPEWEKQFITWQKLEHEWNIRKKLPKSDNINFMLYMRDWNNNKILLKQILFNGRHHGVFISIYFWRNSILNLNLYDLGPTPYDNLHSILTPDVRSHIHDIIIDPNFTDKRMIRLLSLWKKNLHYKLFPPII